MVKFENGDVRSFESRSKLSEILNIPISTIKSCIKSYNGYYKKQNLTIYG